MYPMEDCEIWGRGTYHTGRGMCHIWKTLMSHCTLVGLPSGDESLPLGLKHTLQGYGLNMCFSPQG